MIRFFKSYIYLIFNYVVPHHVIKVFLFCKFCFISLAFLKNLRVGLAKALGFFTIKKQID
jgi:hypothetical protein